MAFLPLVGYIIGMSIKHSLASKNRWKGISQKKKSEIMKIPAKQRWAKVSKKKRREWALLMVAKRKAKIV